MDTSEDMSSPDDTLNILVPTTTTTNTTTSVTSSHDDVTTTATTQPPSPSVSSSSAFQSGRVVRLHFTCRAQLPMGSFLRVTGSTLWAPGTNALDPTEATPTVEQLHQFDRECHGSSNTDTDTEITTSNLYTSSVEMVTTPDTYPIWTTRTPVILIWNRRGGSHSTHSAATIHPVLHHYYRYLVVAPGTVRHPGGDDHSDTNNSSNDHVPLSTEDVPMTVQASTSNEATHTGSTIVMEWEDPFQTMLLDDVPTTTSSHVTVATSTSIGIGGVTSQSRNISAVSLNSSVHLASMTHSGHQYRNLPYRTMDIAATTTTATTATTMVNVMDHWNHSEDPTFQPYRIREAVRVVCVVKYIYIYITNRPWIFFSNIVCVFIGVFFIWPWDNSHIVVWTQTRFTLRTVVR
jgi:hypothetical protein